MSHLDFDSYRVTLPYPRTPSAPKPPTGRASPEAFEAHAQKVREYNEEVKAVRKVQAAYREVEAKQAARFRIDAIHAAGLEGHEAANRAFAFAYEEGHSDGYSQVFYYLERIAEVILGDDA